jgi:hypothetical protein
MIRQRGPNKRPTAAKSNPEVSAADTSMTAESRPLLGADRRAKDGRGGRHALASYERGDIVEEREADEMDNMSRRTQWIVLAVASGACAAFNGVFAKL